MKNSSKIKRNKLNSNLASSVDQGIYNSDVHCECVYQCLSYRKPLCHINTVHRHHSWTTFHSHCKFNLLNLLHQKIKLFRFNYLPKGKYVFSVFISWEFKVRIVPGIPGYKFHPAVDIRLLIMVLIKR